MVFKVKDVRVFKTKDHCQCWILFTGAFIICSTDPPHDPKSCLATNQTLSSQVAFNYEFPTSHLIISSLVRDANKNLVCLLLLEKKILFDASVN